MVPFDTQSPMVTSGIRVGAAAITSRGFKENDCLQVVDWMDAILSDVENEALNNKVRAEVNGFMQGVPLYEGERVRG